MFCRVRARQLCLLKGMDDKTVVEQTISWLAWLFHVPAETLNFSMEFGSDLNPSFASDFVENELATVSEEVLYIRRCMGEKLSLARTVHTVGDFCALIVGYQKAHPAGCRRLLARWEKQKTMRSRPFWRRLLFKTFGF